MQRLHGATVVIRPANRFPHALLIIPCALKSKTFLLLIRSSIDADFLNFPAAQGPHEMAENARQYDLIVLGATGYTGRRVADCIVHSLPTDLRWALAGRSDKKIMAQQERLKHAAPDRSYASSEILSWTEDNLEAVARKTTVLINVAGPYTRLGREAVAACVKSRTHYIDVAGESPFISEVVKHFDEPARQAGVIVSQMTWC